MAKMTKAQLEVKVKQLEKENASLLKNVDNSAAEELAVANANIAEIKEVMAKSQMEASLVTSMQETRILDLSSALASDVRVMTELKQDITYFIAEWRSIERKNWFKRVLAAVKFVAELIKTLKEYNEVLNQHIENSESIINVNQ